MTCKDCKHCSTCKEELESLGYSIMTERVDMEVHCKRFEKSSPQLYTLKRGGKAVAYRYGDELEATALFLEGGYKTPEEAIEAYGRKVKNVLS